MNQLMADTLRFLKENFDSDCSWTVPARSAHLKSSKAKVQKPLLLPSLAPKIQPPSFSKEVAKETLPVAAPAAPEPLKAEIPIVPLGLDSLSDAVKNLFPQFTTFKEIPQDKDLRTDPAYKKLVQADVVLFSFREGKESDLFLQNICFAISSHFCSAAVLDVKKWEISKSPFDLFFKQSNAKLFISSDTLYKKSFLLPFLKENPTSSEKFLSESKLILLKSFESYFTDPLHKKELWKTLCATLKKHFPSQASS